MSEALSRREVLARAGAGLGAVWLAACGRPAASPGAGAVRGDDDAAGAMGAGGEGSRDVGPAGANDAGGAATGRVDPVAPAGADTSLENRDIGLARSKGDAVKVELTHDVICPWCRIGHARLAKAIAAVGREVEVVYRPFLLEPDLPEGGADLRERLAAKYGAGSLDGMFDRVTRIGATDGITFDFTKVRRSPNTVKAHSLIDAAPGAAKGRLLDAMHAAYFERGEDIGQDEVLLRLWSGAGLPTEAGVQALADIERAGRVRAEAAAASRRGVRGVPHFDIGELEVSGAQPVNVLVDALSRG